MVKTGSTKSANCDIELTCVTIMILREMIEERYIATPSRKQRQRTGNRHAQTPLLRLILDPLDLQLTVYFEADLQRGFQI